MTRICILFLFALAFVGVFIGGGLPILPLCDETGFARVLCKLQLYKLHGNQILLSISTGFLVSISTWFLVVDLPARNRRKLLKNRLRTYYLNFRENVIRTLLLVSDDHDTRVEALLDHMKFREHFPMNKWNNVLNGLQAKPDELQDVLVELDLLASEFAFVLNNLEIDDDQLIRFFREFSASQHRLRNARVYAYDPVKYIGQRLYLILACHDIVSGPEDTDFVSDNIDRL